MDYLGEFIDNGRTQIITQCKCCKTLMFMRVGDFENNRKTVCGGCLSKFPNKRGKHKRKKGIKSLYKGWAFNRLRPKISLD